MDEFLHDQERIKFVTGIAKQDFALNQQLGYYTLFVVSDMVVGMTFDGCNSILE